MYRFQQAGGNSGGWLATSPVFLNFDLNDHHVSYDVTDSTPNTIFISIP